MVYTISKESKTSLTEKRDVADTSLRMKIPHGCSRSIRLIAILIGLKIMVLLRMLYVQSNT